METHLEFARQKNREKEAKIIIFPSVFFEILNFIGLGENT